MCISTLSLCASKSEWVGTACESDSDSMCLYMTEQITVRSHGPNPLLLSHPAFCRNLLRFPPHTPALITERSHKEANHHHCDWTVKQWDKGTVWTHQRCAMSPGQSCLQIHPCTAASFTVCCHHCRWSYKGKTIMPVVASCKVITDVLFRWCLFSLQVCLLR